MLIICTLLCNRSLEFSILQNWNSISIERHLSISLYPQPRTHHSTCQEFDYFRYLWKWNHAVFGFFCAWFIFPSTLSLKFIHAVTCNKISLFFLRLTFHCKYVPHFLHSFINGHLGCFCLLAEWWCSKLESVNRSLKSCCQFFWIYTWRRDFWIIYSF